MGQLRAIAGVSFLLFASNGLDVRAAPPAAGDTVTADQVGEVPVAVLPAQDTAARVPIRRAKAKANPYDVNGFDDGAFQLRPTLQVGAVISNNATLSATAPKADAGLELKPSFSFQSEWSRHEWRGSASADVVRYANTPEAGSLTGSAETSFRLDIRHTTHADFSASVLATQANAGSSEVPGSAISARRDTSIGTAAGLTHDFGSFEGQAKTALVRNTYGDVALVGGGTERNIDRNYVEPALTLRGTYGHERMPLRPYVEARYDPRFHDQVLDRNGQRRNSQGVGVALGAVFDDGPIWKGDVAGNFIARSYDDPALKTAMALGVNGTVTWSPTPLWSIVAATGVSLAESEEINVAATPNWTASLQANYAWRDNVTFRGSLALGLAGTSSGGLDTTTVASLGADWQINPNMALSGTLQNTWFAPAVGTGAYSEQRVMSSIVLRP